MKRAFSVKYFITDQCQRQHQLSLPQLSVSTGYVQKGSCPSCGFDANRDANAAYNIFRRRLHQLGLGQAEVAPGETATAAETDGGSLRSVPTRRGVESRSLGACPRCSSHQVEPIEDLNSRKDP